MHFVKGKGWNMSHLSRYVTVMTPPACVCIPFTQELSCLRREVFLLTMHAVMQEAKGRYGHGFSACYCHNLVRPGFILDGHKETQEYLTGLAEMSAR